MTHLLQCASPGSRSGPSFALTLRRPILFQPPPLLTPDKLSDLRIACTPILKRDAAGRPQPALTAYFGFDATFAQTWNLTAVTVGDLASTMALAPGEKLTLEFQSSQRKVLEQSTLESNESLSSTESTTADKELINIARSSSVTQGWHVDTTATLTCGYASLSVTGGYSKSVNEANQQAINHIHDTTQHSAKSLKALHKIEVRGVTEGIIQNRMTRTIANPYNDRSVALNVFHLLKHFSVQTALSELRAAIVLTLDGLAFDSDFVLRNADFIRANLLDTSLLDDLPVAIQGAKPALQSTNLYEAIDTAKRALRLLYSYDHSADNMFNVQHIGPPAVDPNPPAESFNATYPAHSGLDAALANHSAGLFVVLNYFWSVINEKVNDPTGPGQILLVDKDDQAIRIATALAAQLNAQWQLLYPDPLKSDELRHLLDQDNLTEIFRRVPGFLTMIEGILQPLLDPARAEQAALTDYAQAQFVLQHLLEHLECNRNYYVQRYLRYIAQTTDNQAIIDLATDAVNALVQNNALPKLVTIGDFDLDRTFIDKREVIIPGFLPLSATDVSALLAELLPTTTDTAPTPQPVVDDDLEVAADGIHLELAAGTCVLEDVAPPPHFSGNVTIKDLNLSIDG